VICDGLDWMVSDWLVPETAASEANSGRAPKAVRVTHWLVPFRQALMVAVWPSVRGPTESVVVAIPLTLVRDEAFDCVLMPGPLDVKATDWPAVGTPLASARA